LVSNFPMERDSGLQRGWNVRLCTNFISRCVGGNALRRKFIKAPSGKPGDTVIALGCGPRTDSTTAPEMNIWGSTSPIYTADAKLRHGKKGTFVVGDTKSLWTDPRSEMRYRDRTWHLHHLEDEAAMHCIRFAHRAM